MVVESGQVEGIQMFCRTAEAVGDKQSPYVYGFVVCIVDLYPVLKISMSVFYDRIIGSTELVDEQSGNFTNFICAFKVGIKIHQFLSPSG